MSVKISVIVPIFNSEQYLAHCINSILNQSYQDFELILVDDGSPDNCGAICDEYAAKDPRIRVIHKENGGVSSARNAGLDAATGDFISFIDSDDWIHPNTYEFLIRAQAEFNSDATTMNNIWIASSSSEFPIISYENILKRYFSSEHLRKNYYFSFHSPHMRNVFTCGLYGMYRNSCFFGVRFDENISIGEDLDIIYRLNLRINNVVHLDVSLYYYRSDNQSATRSPFSSKHLTVLTAYLKMGDAIALVDSKQAHKMYYRYIYQFFDIETKVRLTSNLHLANEFRHYRNTFTDKKNILLFNPYLSCLERIMIVAFLLDWKVYRILFGKAEQQMLRKIDNFLS